MNETATSKLAGWPALIATTLRIDDEKAMKVFDEMCANGFDFSKSSKAKFSKEAKLSLQTIEMV